MQYNNITQIHGPFNEILLVLKKSRQMVVTTRGFLSIVHHSIN
jgi:hypothetical protein